MNKRFVSKKIHSIYQLNTCEAEIFNMITEYFSQELFHNTKPKFKFVALVIDKYDHHFFCNIGGFDINVSIKRCNLLDYIYKRSNGIDKKYFSLYEQTTYIEPDYDKPDFWYMKAAIAFDKKRFVADEKK
ncbi:TPA: hypothetical protein ACUMPZ_001380 [Haemophilus influenzae]